MARCGQRGGTSTDGSGHGGGGRIAVHSANLSAFSLNSISAPGGGFGSGAGTVYLRDTDEPFGTLIIDNIRTAASQYIGFTPLGMPGAGSFEIPDAVVIRGPETHVRNEHPGLALVFQRGLTLTNFGRLHIDGNLHLDTVLVLSSSAKLEVTGTLSSSLPLTVDGGATLDVTGRLISQVPLTIASGGIFRMAGPFAPEQPVMLPGGRLYVNGDFEARALVDFSGGGLIEITGTYSSATPVAVSGGTLTADVIAAPALTLSNSAVLTSRASTATQMNKLEISVAGTITVSTNSRIDVSGKGYLPGRTTGNTTVGGATGQSGGSYGGLGVSRGANFLPGSANAVYGDYADPDDWGSGGSDGFAVGGGLVRIAAATLVLDGQVLANGRDGFQPGGGAGGGIRVAVTTLQGTGSMRASGGSASGGVGGGGGRIAVYAADYSTFNVNSISAPGGGFGSGAGTVHIANGRPHTHVRSFQPKGKNGGLTGNEIAGIKNRTGYLKDSFAGFTFEFNERINTNTLPGSLSVTGPAGAIAPLSFGAIGDRRYQVTIPPQTEHGSYWIELSPSLQDTEGFALDQDADGVTGESPEDAYSYKLIIDTVPPRITRSAPDGDVAGTITSLDVLFTEAIDKTTFTSADVTVRNPTNGTIAVNSVTEFGFNRFRVAFPSQIITGRYHVVVGPNIADLAGNLLDQDRDGTAGEVGEDSFDAAFNLVPVDLELSNVSVTTNLLVAGETVAVSWQGRNTTGVPLVGDWVDGLYLSPDPFWNITDIPLGTVAHTGGLAADQVYSASKSFNVPGLLPGNYYLLVRADVGNATRETVEVNNLVSFGPVPLSVRQAAIGSSVSGTLTPGNRLQYFAINIPAGENLRLSLNGQFGINHLFVNHASIPTALKNDFRGIAANADQSITLTGVPGGGTYYILVYAAQLGVTSNFELSAESGALFLNRISPAQQVKRSGERFWSIQQITATAVLEGEGFDPSIQVRFVGSNGIPRVPTRISFGSPSILKLTLDLASWPADSYHVQVTKGPVTRTLTNAFHLSEEGTGKLEARVIAPAVRPAGGQTLYLEYSNVGNAPMPAPLLKVTAYTNAIIVTRRLNRRPQDQLDSRAMSGGPNRSRASGNSIPSYAFRVGIPLHTIQVMAVGSGGTPGILQPGESGRVPVYFGGLNTDRGEQSIQFSVGSVTADDTTIIDLGSPAPGIPNEYKFPRDGTRRPLPPSLPFVPDWSALETTSKPETVSVDAWGAVWQNVVGNSGPLWADYVVMLGDNMNYLASISQSTNDPAALFNFEVSQATGALHPVRTLAGAVDAAAPSPGFPLVFRRVYGQSILSRYKLGPLGRGWTHNWDISVQPLTKFQGVVVHGPGGADRFFGRYNNGTYTPTSGDSGNLTETNKIFQLTETDGTVLQFNTHARLEYVEDPNGNRITCGYTGDLLTELTHTSGKQLVLAYNGADRIASLTDPRGPGVADDRITVFDYDGDHLVRVTAPGNRVITYRYHSTGTPQQLHGLTEVTHPDLTQDSFAYDTQGRLAQTSRNCCGGAQQVNYSYDSAGTVTVTDATGRTTQLLYGLGGQLAQVRDGEGRIVNFTYDDFSQLAELLGPGGERYRYSYDDFGNLSAIEDPLRQPNTFGYEANFNRLAQVRDARGNALQYAYDNRGNLTAITYADNTRELFAYDARGNVVTSTNRRGSVITYAYNPAGQLTFKDYSTTPGITDFTYAYDSTGNLTNTTYWNPLAAPEPGGGGSTQETLNLQYDPFTDRLTRIQYPGGRFLAFDYDAAGRRTRRSDQDGHISAYLYDPLGRLARMTNELGQIIVNYDYDAAGRLNRKTLGNGVFTTYTYNNAGQVTQLVNSRADSNVLSSFSYTYDASGRRASMTTLAGTETYGYDPLGQLTSVTYPNARVVNYAYDAADNRTQVTDNGVPATYAANTLNQYTSAGASTFGYDLDGNLTNKTESATNTVYTYDLENRLIGVATPADTWTYNYDAFGNRIAATHNGQTTRYVIDPTGLGNVAAEYDGGGSLVARYEHGFGLLARTDAAGDPAFYTFSAIGHTSELTDPAGAVANAYAYDPFGLSLAKTETIPNPFEFVGEFGVMNEGNGLEFMRARFYSGALGKFVQRDPVGIRGGINLYSYALNSPSLLFDPTGLRSDDYTVAIPNTPAQGPSLGSPPTQEQQDFRDEMLMAPILLTGVALSLAVDGWRDIVIMILTSGIPIIDDDELGGQTYTWNSQYGFFVSDGGEILRINPFDIDPTFQHERKNADLVRSRDPNDKLGPSGYGSAGYLPAGGVIAYQIRFENQPSATAPAQRVTVTDTLDPNLDLSTFELTEIAFANQTLALPAGLNHYETRLAFTVTNLTLLPQTGLAAFGSNSIVVDVQAALDVPTRVLTLTLTALDPNTGWYPEDPLTGLLYPNNTNHIGEGSISYLVRPLAGLSSGATITNRANIVFDYNDPIVTPLVLNTIDANPPSSAVTSLTGFTTRQFLVQWSGSDDATGIARYDVYVSENGSNYVNWLQGITNTSALFTGIAGNRYSFYAIARDNVGNSETSPTTPDTQTTIFTDIPLVLFPFLAPEGDFGFSFTGQPGRPYVIEVSTNLPSWQVVTNFTATAPTIQFLDPNATNATKRFFRVTTP